MHPSRTTLHNELHARPSIYFNGPAHVFHVALIESGKALDSIVRRILAAGTGTSSPELSQGILKIDGLATKWERHTEFLTITMVVPGEPRAEYWPPILPQLEALISGHEHLLINSTQIRVESAQECDENGALHGFKDPAGSSVGGGDAVILSDFRLTPEGTNRLLLTNRSLNSYRLGRMVRRLLEIETYRMMASLALPEAKELSRQLKEFDKELEILSEKNASAIGLEARQILDEISIFSAKIVRLKARAHLRLEATEAYAQIVFERIAELKESPVSGHQQLGNFIERRFKPTVRFCHAIHCRLNRLANSVAQLGELLQARVQVDVEEQNSAILSSLHSRASTQIKIQKTVEGLSIIAISYYLLSLFKFLYEGLNSLGFDISPRTAGIYLTPAIACTIGVIALHIRKTKEESSD